ncbi:phosphate acetyltransferase [Naumannella halotolerans]|uniref:Phosphate acetyltransferase n=1 Tax=Naumannella halotolerans TaxID=993414 RepID=A0A4V3ENK5_9ACTN|nr:phosphate acetyltransferase [Naumannella halotolerans]TDT34068.1 phosphate acetyltransferase [Naumannella halotolerans]
MARSVYVTSAEGHTGKSSVALGLIELLAAQVRVGVFRPIARDDEQPDSVLELLLQHDGVDLDYEQCIGVTYDAVHADPDAALAEIIGRYRKMESLCDVVVIVGSDYTDVAGPTELSYNARIAANLGSAVVLVVSALHRQVDEVRQMVEIATGELRAGHAEVVAVITNRADPDQLEPLRRELAAAQDSQHPIPTWVMPDVPLLSAPTLANLQTAVDGRLVAGDVELLEREAESTIVGGMTMDHILDRLVDGAVVVVPGDRSDVVLAVVAAHASENFPSLAGLILNGGFEPSPQVSRLIAGLPQRLPIVATDLGTYDTARTVAETKGLLSKGSQRKLDTARATFAQHVDGAELLRAVDLPRSGVVTPLMFEYDLIERARSQRKTIVLPEGEDDRILRAASTLISRDVADLVILGDDAAIRARGSELGLDLGPARILSTSDPELRERFAEAYAEVRAHRGMTLDRAREIVVDVSYFGTMMVQLGLADGMVSGAMHTTAHTIKPSFEIIKTVPGVSIVSSVFFMCLADRVLVYGDCAVNPDPSAEQLADIAISSAATAKQFGVEPRVAMLSYSTGSSGSGADVDKVRIATEMVHERAPELVVDGPIQYDAAVDASVGQQKLPGSQVAGQATVFIFPDLNTGNNTYKAVQRSSGAVAVGPVLQGLNKPVNDLSRGALVQDIVNTVAITAIQAQGRGELTGGTSA